MAKYKQRKDGRYYTTFKPTRDAKPQFIYAKSSKELDDKIAELKTLANKGVELNNEGILVEKLADSWFNLYQKKNAKSTQKRVKGLLDNYIKKELGHIPIKHLKSYHVQKMLNEIQEYHTDTTRKVLQIIKSMLEFAVNNDYCIKNVAKACTIKKYESKKREILTNEEIKTLENTDNKYKDFFVFLLYTGLRRGEIAGLKWSDIDFKNKEIHVSRSMSFITNKGELKSTKTNKTRNVPILDKTFEILHRRKKTTNSIYVFSQQDGHNLTESSIDRMHESILKSTGLTFKLHELRHTFCTTLYYAGVSSIQAAEIMGHSLAVMQEIYTHLDKDKAKEEVQKLNDYISKN